MSLCLCVFVCVFSVCVFVWVFFVCNFVCVFLCVMVGWVYWWVSDYECVGFLYVGQFLLYHFMNQILFNLPKQSAQRRKNTHFKTNKKTKTPPQTYRNTDKDWLVYKRTTTSSVSRGSQRLFTLWNCRPYDERWSRLWREWRWWGNGVNNDNDELMDTWIHKSSKNIQFKK